VVTGYYTDNRFVDHGFVRDADDNVTTFDVLDTVFDTRPYAINNSGDIVGTYPVHKNGVTHCFIRHPDGTIVPFDPDGEPRANDTATSINDNGEIAGTVSHHTGGRSGYLRDSSGETILVSGPAGYTAGVQAVSNSGHFTGTLVDSHGIQHGFVQ
jgi:hypothetical protein